MRNNNIYKDYEKAAKWIGKAERLYIQRENNDIYLSDTHYLIKIDISLYSYCFRTVSPRFIDIQEGSTACAQEKKALPALQDNKFRQDFRKCIPNIYEYTYAEITPFTVDNPGHNDLRLVSIADNEEMTYINNEFFQVLKIFARGTWYGKNKRSPLLTDFNNDIAVMILPVNWNNNSKFQVVNAEKVERRLTA